MRPLALLLGLGLIAGAASAQDHDAAVRALLGVQARAQAARASTPSGAAQIGASAYDAAGAAAPAPAVIVPPSSAQRASSAAAPASRAEANSSAPSAPVTSTRFSDGYLGIYPESEFTLTTGRCRTCNLPLQGGWYFLDDVVAAPKTGSPALIWIGSHALLEGVTLSDDGGSIRLADGTVMPFSLTEKYQYNRSYYDPSSVTFFKGRTLRLRGEIVEAGGQKRFVARTIWPEDFRVDFGSLQKAAAANDSDVDRMVGEDEGGAKDPFAVRLLWSRDETRDWAGRPVMGVMLNGAQGDDDESLAGHFSLFTGRFGPHGEMADWLFSNFYDMDQVSEKSIVPALVPMDKYMADLNAGQSWYRPTAMLVLVLRDERLADQVQQQFRDLYRKYYSHEVRYNRVTKPCASLVIDELRADGWNIPDYGSSASWADVMKVASRFIQGKDAAQAAYDSAMQEKTRLIPRAAFTAVGGDVLRLAGAQGQSAGRALTPFERMIQQDLDALLYVRLPQLPSSRKYGRDPIESVQDYMWRELKLSHEHSLPTPSRPFPPPHP